MSNYERNYAIEFTTQTPHCDLAQWLTAHLAENIRDVETSIVTETDGSNVVWVSFGNPAFEFRAMEYMKRNQRMMCIETCIPLRSQDKG